MNIQLGEILSVGLGLVFGILMIVIALGFVPALYTTTGQILDIPDIGNYTGSVQTYQAFPSFIGLALLIVGLGIMLGPGAIVGARVYQRAKGGGGKKGKT